MPYGGGHPTAYVTCSPSKPLNARESLASSANSPLASTRAATSDDTTISSPVVTPDAGGEIDVLAEEVAVVADGFAGMEADGGFRF